MNEQDVKAILDIIEQLDGKQHLDSGEIVSLKIELRRAVEAILTEQLEEKVELQHLRDIKQMVAQLQAFQDQRYETITERLGEGDPNLYTCMRCGVQEHLPVKPAPQEVNE